MNDTDLFGVATQHESAMTDVERKRARRRAAERPKGYAAPPGSGPQGETCGSCAHHYTRHWAKTYHKCDLIKATKGPGSDIRVRSPACSRWQADDPNPREVALGNTPFQEPPK